VGERNDCIRTTQRKQTLSSHAPQQPRKLTSAMQPPTMTSTTGSRSNATSGPIIRHSHTAALVGPGHLRELLAEDRRAYGTRGTRPLQLWRQRAGPSVFGLAPLQTGGVLNVYCNVGRSESCADIFALNHGRIFRDRCRFLLQSDGDQVCLVPSNFCDWLSFLRAGHRRKQTRPRR